MLQNTSQKQPTRHHIFHGRILADYFGTPAFDDANGVVHEASPPLYSPPKFIRRFRMSPRMFMKLYHDITDPVTGHDKFRKGPDALGVMGVTPLQKLVSVVRCLPMVVVMTSRKSTPVFLIIAGGLRCTIFVIG